MARDVETYSWPGLAKEAQLSTVALHMSPHEIAPFAKSEVGHRFFEECNQLGLVVEHEMHALSDLLPRELFAKDPTMFRMNEKGERLGDANLCVHSERALEIAAENAARYTRELRTSTGRYFFWIDDARSMCHCPKCRDFLESDQALILENHLLRAIRKVDEKATLAHLAYANTIDAPKQVKPAPGIFLEFAPIERRYDVPFSDREAKSARRNFLHSRLLDALDANLAWFGREGAQVLEYWLDVSRFATWKREQTIEIPWKDEVFRDDLAMYAKRGIRHVTTFAAWLDGEYAKRWGVAPVKSYGAGLARWRHRGGSPVEL